MATQSSTLAGESHGQRNLAGYSPRDCKESNMTEVTSYAHRPYPHHTHTHRLFEGALFLNLTHCIRRIFSSSGNQVKCQPYFNGKNVKRPRKRLGGLAGRERACLQGILQGCAGPSGPEYLWVLDRILDRKEDILCISSNGALGFVRLGTSLRQCANMPAPLTLGHDCALRG